MSIIRDKFIYLFDRYYGHHLIVAISLTGFAVCQFQETMLLFTKPCYKISSI